MPTVVTALAKRVMGTGEQTYEAAVPAAVEAVRIAVDRTSFTGAQIPNAIKLNYWLSQDNGATWDYQGGVGIPIGVAVVDGSTITESGMQRPVPGVGNAQRRVRIHFEIVRQAVNTALTLTLLP